MDLAGGCNVEIAVRTAGISDATYYKWRKTYGGMGKSKLHEFKWCCQMNANSSLYGVNALA
ncbi:MAG: transposase, partial [Rhodospirillales bacterium]|nr:transposase [Rhodospirillales bacterium]